MSKGHKEKIKEAEVVKERPQSTYLMTVLVLTIALVQAVTGDSPQVLEGDSGQKIVEFIGDSIKKTFPEIAPMIMGLFGIELMQLMPVLKNPEKMIKEMVKSYTGAAFYVSPNPEPDTK